MCPVFCSQAGLLNHAGRQRLAPPDLAFFQGKLNLHIPYEYSFGIRQGLFKAHRNNPRIVVKEGHEANREAYYENMCGSRFCVAAAGFGFSTRAYEASVAGCVASPLERIVKTLAARATCGAGTQASRLSGPLLAMPQRPARARTAALASAGGVSSASRSAAMPHISAIEISDARGVR